MVASSREERRANITHHYEHSKMQLHNTIAGIRPIMERTQRALMG